MAHEILSIKLCELEDQLARLLSRIQLSETADPAALKRDLEALRHEYAENALALQAKLDLSRAEIVSTIAHTYADVQRALAQGRDALQAPLSAGGAPAAEARILLAEYALDFAVQAANHALLLSMEAIDAQATSPEEGREPS